MAHTAGSGALVAMDRASMLRSARAPRRSDRMLPREQEQTDDDTGTPRSDRVADAEAEHDATRSPAQQAIINEEQAFESGDENPS